MERYTVQIWVLGALSLVFMAGPLQAKDFKNIVETEIRKHRLSKKNFGVWMDIKGHNYSLNENTKMIPASLSKLVTASAVFHHLPLGHKFKTQILSAKKPSKGVLASDLYLKGGGDPSFVSESMWYLVNVLKRRGFQRIQGDIIVDDTLFDKVRFAKSRQAYRVDRAYDAPIGAMSFNWNSVNVFINPGEKIGAKPIVTLDPPNKYFRLVNTAKTIRGSKGSIRISRRTAGDGVDQIFVSGTFGVSQKEKVAYKSISSPEQWAGQNLKAFLERQGFVISGKVKVGRVPANAIVLAEKESDSLVSVVSGMSKFSNNFVAEMLTKYLGYHKKKQGTMDAGMSAIHSYLQTLGWGKDDYVMENPSGFTRDNLFKPRLLGQLLKKDWKNFSYSSELISGFPIGGVDGTLKKRMQGKLKGKIRAKTGYLKGVIGVAGYMEGPGDEPLVFVMVFNGDSKHDWTVRAMFDKILAKILGAVETNNYTRTISGN